MSDKQTIEKLAQKNKALEKQTAFLQSTLDAVAANIAVLDESGMIIAINEEWRRFAKANGLGWADHGLGRNYLEICQSVTGEDAAMALAAANGIGEVITRQRAGFDMEYPCHSPDQRRWFQMRTTRFEDKGSIRVVVTHMDITRRKLAEEAVRQSEYRFHSLFEQFPISIWEEDWTAIKDFLDALPVEHADQTACYLERHPEVVQRCVRMAHIIDVNQATLALFEAHGDKEMLKSLPKLFTDETFDSYKKALIALQKGDRFLEMETVVKTLSGARRNISLRWSVPAGSETRPVRVLVSMVDITLRKQAETQLLRYQKELRSLSAELSLVEERERRRIATELHDNLGQTLALAKIQLGSLQSALSPASKPELVADIQKLIEESIRYSRSLTSEVSPPVLYHLSFASSIEWLAENILEKSGLEVTIADDGQPKPLEDDTRVLLFKAVRELMVNVVKHARARKVILSLRSEADQMIIQIEDDGVGFDISEKEVSIEAPQRYGIFSIQERLTYLGGEFELCSSPNRGTRARLAVPLQVSGTKEMP